MDCGGLWWECMIDHGDTCIPGDACITRDTCILRDTCIHGDTCIPGVHVSPGIHDHWGTMASLESSELQRKFKKSFFWPFNTFQICHVKKMILFISKTIYEYSAPSKFILFIFKISISRNHAYCVLHSRFSPFGFVLKSIQMSFHLNMADSCQSHCSKRRFHETMPIVFSIVDFPPSGLY